MGLLAASLIYALLAQPVSLGGQPCLARFAVIAVVQIWAIFFIT